ncbi:MAG: hypothetical protein ACOXZ0_05330 [Eubacteriales bacterium]|jgi:hypothetical protein
MEAVGKYLKAGMVTGAELRLFFTGKVRKTRRGCVSGRRDEERSEDGRLFSIFLAGTEIGKMRAVIEWEKTV